MKRVGAVKVEAAYVDIPSSGSDVKRLPLRKYLAESLNHEFNYPERISEELATPTGTIEYNESNQSMKTYLHKQIEETQNGKGYFAASARDWRQVVRKGTRASVLALGSRCGVDPTLSAGAFCVLKSADRLRLICDRRARNIQERTQCSESWPS